MIRISSFPASWNILRAALPAFAIFALTAGPVHAAGFYIQEQSVSGLGSAFSGSVTNLRDPSTVYFNPAGMTRLPGTRVQAAAHLLVPKSDLRDTGTTIDANGPGAGGVIDIDDHPTFSYSGNGGNPYDPTPVPNGFMSHELGNGWWVGLSVTAPFGLGNEYENGWFGRYDSMKTHLKIMDIQPSIAWRANDWLSLGGGLNFQRAEAELTSTVTNFVTEGTSSLEGEDYSAGYTLGAQATPWSGGTVGLGYHSPVSHELSGQLNVSGVAGLNERSKASAKLRLPDYATLGVAQQLDAHWTLQAQATWFGWNRFDTIRAVRSNGTEASNIQQNYQNTWAFAIGAEYRMDDKWTFRAGVQFDETPTVDEFRTSRTPDGDRTWVSVGATHALNGFMDLDLAATYIMIADEEINVMRNGGYVNVRADTGGSVGIIASGLTFKF